MFYRKVVKFLLCGIASHGITGEAGLLNLDQVETTQLQEIYTVFQDTSSYQFNLARNHRTIGSLFRDSILLFKVRTLRLQNNWIELDKIFTEFQNLCEEYGYDDPKSYSNNSEEIHYPILFVVYEEIKLVQTDMIFNICLVI